MVSDIEFHSAWECLIQCGFLMSCPNVLTVKSFPEKSTYSQDFNVNLPLLLFERQHEEDLGRWIFYLFLCAELRAAIGLLLGFTLWLLKNAAVLFQIRDQLEMTGSLAELGSETMMAWLFSTVVTGSMALNSNMFHKDTEMKSLPSEICGSSAINFNELRIVWEGNGVF